MILIQFTKKQKKMKDNKSNLLYVRKACQGMGLFAPLKPLAGVERESQKWLNQAEFCPWELVTILMAFGFSFRVTKYWVTVSQTSHSWTLD